MIELFKEQATGTSAPKPKSIIFTLEKFVVLDEKSPWDQEMLIPMDGTEFVDIEVRGDLFECSGADKGMRIPMPEDFQGYTHGMNLTSFGRGFVTVDLATSTLHFYDAVEKKWVKKQTDFPGGYPAGTKRWDIVSCPLYASNGNLYTYTLNAPEGKNKFFRSSDEGKTWTEAMKGIEEYMGCKTFQSRKRPNDFTALPWSIWDNKAGKNLEGTTMLLVLESKKGGPALAISRDEAASWTVIELAGLVAPDEDFYPHIGQTGDVYLFTVEKVVHFPDRDNITTAGGKTFPYPGMAPGTRHQTINCVFGATQGFVVGNSCCYNWWSDGYAGRIIKDTLAKVEPLSGEYYFGEYGSEYYLALGNAGEVMILTNLDERDKERKVKVGWMRLNPGLVPVDYCRCGWDLYVIGSQAYGGDKNGITYWPGVLNGRFLIPDAKLGPFAKLIPTPRPKNGESVWKVSN